MLEVEGDSAQLVPAVVADGVALVGAVEGDGGDSVLGGY